MSVPVYNIIQQDTRFLKVHLWEDWGEGGSLLGATIRYENYEDAHVNILLVQDVYLDSPSHEAGLVPFKDFIVGTRELCFTSLDEF